MSLIPRGGCGARTAVFLTSATCPGGEGSIQCAKPPRRRSAVRTLGVGVVPRRVVPAMGRLEGGQLAQSLQPSAGPAAVVTALAREPGLLCFCPGDRSGSGTEFPLVSCSALGNARLTSPRPRMQRDGGGANGSTGPGCVARDLWVPRSVGFHSRTTPRSGLGSCSLSTRAVRLKAPSRGQEMPG